MISSDIVMSKNEDPLHLQYHYNILMQIL